MPGGNHFLRPTRAWIKDLVAASIRLAHALVFDLTICDRAVVINARRHLRSRERAAVTLASNSAVDCACRAGPPFDGGVCTRGARTRFRSAGACLPGAGRFEAIFFAAALRAFLRDTADAMSSTGVLPDRRIFSEESGMAMGASLCPALRRDVVFGATVVPGDRAPGPGHTRPRTRISRSTRIRPHCLEKMCMAFERWRGAVRWRMQIKTAALPACSQARTGRGLGSRAKARRGWHRVPVCGQCCAG
jgi:hypothetical protein